MKLIHVTLLFLLLVLSVFGQSQTIIRSKTGEGTLGEKPSPARLGVIIQFLTPSGLGILYENETGSVQLSISNSGDLIARGVTVRVFMPRSILDVRVDSLRVVGDIPARDTARTSLVVSTSHHPSKQTVGLPVVVSDSTGVTSTHLVFVSVDSRSPQPVDPPDQAQSGGRSWLFVIGIDDYMYWPPLLNAAKDAQAVKELLLQKYGFDPDGIVELYNESATRVNIIKKLEYLARNVKPEDNLVVYYAGHGSFEEMLNRGYWVPVDAEIGSTAQYLPNTDLQSFVAAMRSRATLVISDACFSGTLFREGSARVPDVKDELYYQRVSKLKARQALISGGNEPVMDTGLSSQHSVFAYYLIDRLTANHDRFMTVTTLFERIKRPISNSSSQTPQCRPIHNAGDEGGEFIFVRGE